MKRISLIALTLTIYTQFAFAATAEKQTRKVIWDAWFTVTAKPGMHYAYFNDKAEIRGSEIFYQNHFKKNEEGFINEEEVGALSKNNDDLTPLFFNFHGNYRSTETVIDGNIKDGHVLTVKARRGGKDLPITKKSVPSRTFLSTFFPYWLGKKLQLLAGTKDAKPGKAFSFSTLLEDSLDQEFPISPGMFRLESPDDFSKKTKTMKVMVETRGQKSIWYVEANGLPLRIDLSSQGMLIERTTQEKAEAFLSP